MRILIDIGHPGHVHYFKNFIKIMSGREHDVLVTARDRGHIFDLLKSSDIKFVGRGKGSSNPIGKLAKMPLISYRIYKSAVEFMPDIFLSFASMYAAQASKIVRKPHIAFDDTEHSTFARHFYAPFTNVICTPSCFQKDIGRKQLRFDSYMEVGYLHPKYFSPDPTILSDLGLSTGEQFFIVRFVAWDAYHDAGHTGLDTKAKRSLIDELERRGRVFISSEKPLTDALKQYQLKIAPSKLHHLLNYATLFVGEGATMASESSVLGTKAVYINNIGELGYLIEQQDKYGNVICFNEFDNVLECVVELLTNDDLKQESKLGRERILSEKIDTTAFMVWLVENYPESIDIVREDKDYLSGFLF